MPRVPTRRTLPVLLAAAALGASPAPPADAPVERLTLVAPGSQGGGWDQTARAMRDALTEAGLAREVVVVNSPGAGGAIGLAEFVHARRGDGDALLVGGLVMMSALRANSAAVSVAQATPVARLTGDHEVIAVPAASDVRDMADLVQAVRANPSALSWGGGSVGGADQLTLNALARAIGVEPVHLGYVAYSGGGQVAEALLSNEINVGISGYSEFEAHLRAGRLRALAVASETRLPGVDVPTLREAGIEVTQSNWRGVFAPPGLTAGQQTRLLAVVERMAATPQWRAALRRHRWTDLYLPGPAFASFLADEGTRLARAPDPRGTRSATRPNPVRTARMWLLRNRQPVGAAAVLLLAAAALLVVGQRHRARDRERDLSRRLEAAEEESRLRSAEAQHLLQGVSEQIDRQFEAWALTAAEREIALLMLKGLRHKEIATLRGTSERTVRQQALTIYKKAGLEGRTDLTAFFLEDLLQPVDATRRHHPA
jgi:putative tricarboxylic transport membrane protein